MALLESCNSMLLLMKKRSTRKFHWPTPSLTLSILATARIVWRLPDCSRYYDSSSRLSVSWAKCIQHPACYPLGYKRMDISYNSQNNIPPYYPSIPNGIAGGLLVTYYTGTNLIDQKSQKLETPSLNWGLYSPNGFPSISSAMLGEEAWRS